MTFARNCSQKQVANGNSIHVEFIRPAGELGLASEITIETVPFLAAQADSMDGTIHAPEGSKTHD